MRALTLCCWLAACAVFAAPVPKPKEELFRSAYWDKPVDPDKDCRFTYGKDTLTIAMPAKEHDFGGARKKLNAPYLVTDLVAEGEFRMEVRVKGDFKASADTSAPGAPSRSAAGLFVLFDGSPPAGFRVEFGRAWHKGAERAFFSAGHVSAGTRASLTYYDDERWWPLKPGAKEAYLRLDRKGNYFMPYLSADGKKWKQIGWIGHGRRYEFKLGVTACSTSKHPLKVTFDEFYLAPLKPKDE
jgi:regulation of enolase protein 1 (concanavalin A-like superfamily)